MNIANPDHLDAETLKGSVETLANRLAGSIHLNFSLFLQYQSITASVVYNLPNVGYQWLDNTKQSQAPSNNAHVPDRGKVICGSQAQCWAATYYP